MSDENKEVLEDEITEVELDEKTEDTEVDDLQEFKADDGQSEVPEPTAVKNKPLKGKGTKVSMLNAMMTKMHGMKKEELHAHYKTMMGEEVDSTDENEEIVEGTEEEDTSISVSVSPEDIDLSADVTALFGDEELSEEFKQKATTIFEAAVVSRINEKLAEVTQKLESDNLLEAVKTHEEMVEKTDNFLDYVINEWNEENRLAIEAGCRTEIAEEFMTGLKKLFEDSYIDIPDSKVDVLADINEKAEKLEEDLNREIAKNVELSNSLEQMIRSNVVADASYALTDANSEKLVNLAAGVEFVSEEDFREKVDMIKESYFTDEDKVESFVDENEPLEVSEDDTPLPQNMAHYAAAISRSIKK